MLSRLASMRWWLALLFAGIAALTAFAVAQVFTARSEAAIRERAQELVAGATVAAAATIPPDASDDLIRARTARFGESRSLALFAFRSDGTLVTPPRRRGVSVEALPNLELLLERALSGRRLVDTLDDQHLVTVALPMRRDRAAALVGVAAPSDFEAALGIVRDEIVSAALWATAIGAFTGLVVALLITRRMRRIAAVAAGIERGRFDQTLRPRFPDELGHLAGTIDHMREQLRLSFGRLEDERRRLQVLLEQLQEGVVAVDRRLVVEFANSRARLLVDTGLEPGRDLPDPWPVTSLRDAVGSMFVPGATARTLRVQPDPDRTFLVGLLPPRPDEESAVVVVTDVTQRERRERAEREFVMNAAHELRTPLSAISSAVEVLQQGAKDDTGDRDRFLAIVERQTIRLTRLVRSLLTLAQAQTRSGTVKLEDVPVAPIVREVASALDSAGIEVSPADVAVVAHPDLLRQAVENLATNAQRHAGGRGLTIRAALASEGVVRIQVSDEGPGMTKAEAEKALDRFYRAEGSDGEGFGLGLSIVREVVHAMRGTLAIESRPGEGTTVSIELPAARVESESR